MIVFIGNVALFPGEARKNVEIFYIFSKTKLLITYQIFDFDKNRSKV